MGVGVGEAALSPAAHSSLGDAFPPARLARAMAIYTLGITVGTGVALMVGGSVVDAVTARGDLVLPLLGVRHAWQAAFFAVSLPGIAVAAFVAMTREPKRAVRHADASHGIGALLVYLVANRRAFAAIYGNSTILGIMGYGLVAWYPTLLIRQFGISAGQAANYLGIVYLVIGSAGSLAGGLLAERLARRGHADANLRVVMLISAASIVPATFAPLMPSPLLVMAVFAPLTFLFSGYFGCSIAAIQLATPNGMRATNAAVFLLSNSLIGLSIGAAIIPLVDKWLYGGHGAIGPALSLVGGACCTLGAIAARIGLPAYGAIVSASSAK
jgi:MFS family permease